MTHRSPLVTLIGLVAAFAIMFGVNLASSAPPGSYAGPSPTAVATSAGPTAEPSPAAPSSAAPTSAAPTSAAPSPSASASPTATETEPKTERFPNEVVYAGRTEDGTLAVAVAILGDQAAAYLCDGESVESWMRGRVDGDTVSLRNKTETVELEAKLQGEVLAGKIDLDGGELQFRIGKAKPPAGLYRARGAKTTIGWIILLDGSQVGIQTTGEESVPAPELDPDNSAVTVDGEQLQGEPVTGDQDL